MDTPDPTPTEIMRAAIARAATDPLVASLLRELAWCRLYLQTIATDVEQARAHREVQGGQRAGIPHLVSAPPSLLSYLGRETRHALGGARQDVPVEDLVRAALGERDGAPPALPTSALASAEPPRPVRLTDAQWKELEALGKAMQQRYGRGRARVQNALHDAKLARFTYTTADGEWCYITDAGRARLALGRGPR